MAVPSDILLVIATVVSALALASVVAAWADRRRPVLALVNLAVGLGLFVYVHLAQPGGLAWQDVPNAFVTVAARLLN